MHLDLLKEKAEMAMTHHRGVAKEGFAGLMGVLMMKGAASTERKFLSLEFRPCRDGHLPGES
jgi:hypothetical protein